MTFEVENYEVDNQRIIVEISTAHSDECQIVPINKSAFNTWLDRTSRLNWVENSGLEDERTGEYTQEQYWEYNEKEQISKDIKDYLISREGVKVFDAIKSGIDSICEDYKN